MTTLEVATANIDAFTAEYRLGAWATPMVREYLIAAYLRGTSDAIRASNKILEQV